MSKRQRVKRPKNELKTELIEQLQLLQHSCQSFDRGFEGIGKHIALSLRVLLHNYGKSRALLNQLGLRSGSYLSSVSPLNPRNKLTECNLLAIQISNSEARYLPVIAVGDTPQSLQSVRFEDWWNDPVLKDNFGRTFSRRDLVLNVADSDGGAHVDPELDEAYMAISRNNSLGWYFGNGKQTSNIEGRPELACMRQIAHEVLSTIHKFSTEFKEFSVPIVPTVS
jgi:hypothetical protein